MMQSRDCTIVVCLNWRFYKRSSLRGLPWFRGRTAEITDAAAPVDIADRLPPCRRGIVAVRRVRDIGSGICPPGHLIRAAADTPTCDQPDDPDLKASSLYTCRPARRVDGHRISASFPNSQS